MATVYFTSFKGPGVPRQLDIHPDHRRQVERRCEALALAVTGYPVGRIATGVWKGSFEPSFVADHLAVDDARRLAKAACTVFEQEAALLWRNRATACTHIRVTVHASDAPVVLAALRPDGYTIHDAGEHVFILPVTGADAESFPVPCLIEYGTAEFVTA